jgi:hypothetical protein
LREINVALSSEEGGRVIRIRGRLVTSLQSTNFVGAMIPLLRFLAVAVTVSDEEKL